MGVFEARLRTACETVDFSIRLERAGASLDAGAFPDATRRQALLWSWRREDPGLDPVESLWLEFDLDRRAEPEPVLCARLRPAVSAGWLVDVLFPALHGAPLPARQKARVRRAVEAIPASGRVLYAFSLRPRRDDALRLELFGLDPAAMTGYLAEVVSPAAARRIESLSPLVSGADRYHLSFDVLPDGFGPRLGVELGFRRLPHREPRWREVFDRLVTAGLCAPEKRAAVFGWPGWDTPASARGRWPETVPRGYLVRALSHVKLVSLPDRPAEAKVYLLLQYLERRPTAAAGEAPGS